MVSCFLFCSAKTVITCRTGLLYSNVFYDMDGQNNAAQQSRPTFDEHSASLECPASLSFRSAREGTQPTEATGESGEFSHLVLAQSRSVQLLHLRACSALETLACREYKFFMGTIWPVSQLEREAQTAGAEIGAKPSSLSKESCTKGSVRTSLRQHP